MAARTTVGTCDYCLPLEDRRAIAARTGRSLRSVGATLERDHEDGQPVWRCRNCGRARPRRVLPRPEPGRRTPQQERMLDRFVAAGLKDAGLGDPEGVEVKRLEVTTPERGARLYVLLEVGRKGDEGTLAEAFCRSRWHVVIGVRGGISVCGWGGKGPSPRGLRNVIREGDEDRNRRIARVERKAGEDLPPAQQRVWAELPEDGEQGRSLGDLAQRVGRHRSSVRQALGRLERAGRVRSWANPLGRDRLYARVVS